MELYIKGAGIICYAGNNTEEQFLQTAPDYATDRLLAVEPTYTGAISPMQLRRMSKTVRIGINAAKFAIDQAGIKPDALSIGSASGCLYDTEQFLVKLVEQNEQALSPTPFIQSTHNTVAGQIALLLGCHGHNLTFMQNGHSFEHAIVNAQLYLDDHPGENVLAGGIDELTNTSVALLQAGGLYRKTDMSPDDIKQSKGLGSIAGEGASFFILSNQPFFDNQLCIKDIAFFITADKQEALTKLGSFITQLNIQASDIDMVMLGINGDERNRAFYQQLRKGMFKDNSLAVFKHICGEYATASAVALGIISHMVSTGNYPELLFLNRAPKELKKIILINNHIHYYSFWYLEVI